MITTVLNIVVFIFGLLGAICIARMNPKGFLYFIVHNAVLSYLCLAAGDFGAVAILIIFICLDVYGYFYWGTKNGQK